MFRLDERKKNYIRDLLNSGETNKQIAHKLHISEDAARKIISRHFKGVLRSGFRVPCEAISNNGMRPRYRCQCGGLFFIQPPCYRCQLEEHKAKRGRNWRKDFGTLHDEPDDDAELAIVENGKRELRARIAAGGE